jgi:hypothetical protein
VNNAGVMLVGAVETTDSADGNQRVLRGIANGGGRARHPRHRDRARRGQP